MPVFASGKDARIFAQQLPYPPPPGQQTPAGQKWNVILDPLAVHNPSGMLFQSWSMSSAIELTERTNAFSYGKQYIPGYKDATMSLEGRIAYDLRTGFYLGELVMITIVMYSPNLVYGPPLYGFEVPITITQISRTASTSSTVNLTIGGTVNYIFDRRMNPQYVIPTIGRGFIPRFPIASEMPYSS